MNDAEGHVQNCSCFCRLDPRPSWLQCAACLFTGTLSSNSGVDALGQRCRVSWRRRGRGGLDRVRRLEDAGGWGVGGGSGGSGGGGGRRLGRVCRRHRDLFLAKLLFGL
eukprot:3177102-Rhodomonas_salina.3